MPGANNPPPDRLSWGILEHSIGPRVRPLHNTLAARSIAVSARFGFPTGSLTVLSLIAANPGSSQTALAGRAGLNKSALVGIVDQLEKHGLAARDRSSADRRRNSLLVTPKGEALMKELFETVSRNEQPIVDALGPADTAKLLDLLDRAAAALDPR